MKLKELGKLLHISTESIKKFIQDFDLELSECMATNFEIEADFEKFAIENADFLRKYEKDLVEKKSVDQIAVTINQPKDKIMEVIKKDKPILYDNGWYKSSVSSFGIDHQLGGDYQFIYDYFGKKTALSKRDFIGYRDLFFYISTSLEPFINKEEADNWGIHQPAGIILYGAPGTGKIFWAHKIAEIINYQFREVKKHYLGTTFVDGNKANFNDFLVKTMQEDKILLFMEDFDEIMSKRSAGNTINADDEDTKDIILHYISKFHKENLVMVGSANALLDIDFEILAPGRFDILVPIFPPNLKERTEMILCNITDNLREDATLYQILKSNNADKVPFWQPISNQMKVFSNTMLIDFTQSLKKRLRNTYLKYKSNELKIDENMLQGALRDASVKLTPEYLNQVAQFLVDVKTNNHDEFSARIVELQKELETYAIKEKPMQSIGFHHNEEQLGN